MLRPSVVGSYIVTNAEENASTTEVPSSEQTAAGWSSGCPRSEQTCRVKQSCPLWDLGAQKAS